ncbi:uncharacterized protein LOC143622710 [Bidens hawaiensis]|uniref:uncharacterized protein LOC143622710 n=1 Tax=Bidens hawaiensis TaxID=980011 RepID=UPI00404B5317
MGLLDQYVRESLIMQVSDQKTAKKMWDTIKTRHVGAERVRDARLQMLELKFDRLLMKDSEMIDEYFGKLSGLALKSAALGQVIKEPKLVKKLPNSVLRVKYIQMVASLEQILDLKISMYDDVVGLLKAYEERIENEHIHLGSGNQTNLLYSCFYFNGHNGHEGSRSHGRKNRGRSRGRDKGQDRTQSTSEQSNQTEGKEKVKKYQSKVVFYRCDQLGHFALACPDIRGKKHEAHISETKLADKSFYMHGVVFLNEDSLIPKRFETKPAETDMWYLYNGAGNYMTRSQSLFSELNKRITGKVKFGLNSFAMKIKELKSVFFEKSFKNADVIDDNESVFEEIVGKVNEGDVLLRIQMLFGQKDVARFVECRENKCGYFV